MNFLIGALDPSYDGSGINPNAQIEQQNTPPPIEVEEKVEVKLKEEDKEEDKKKPNWYLYGVLGLIGLAFILGNRK